MGRHLGIDFHWILVDFWKQVGKENGAKIDPKRHRKNDWKFMRFIIDLGGLFGTKLEGQMDPRCIPKGIQKTIEK